MKALKKRKFDLDKKFQRVLKTPASFDFFVAIHDFIEHIELNPFLSSGLSDRLKANRELDIANKYDYLRKIYQGLEDINIKSNIDLGHTRYMVIRELSQIQNKEVSESNSFWRKRELFRKLAGVVYERLNVYLSESIKTNKNQKIRK
ncbi:hypothetical protein COY65_03130 [Candidatus Jorgensenbacteria bacterium CG_4_10_14_0_8_um_filter_39_13]|uniref:Uncharacterized protein n=1 Tax=Candidatus Jorgensenbacteria bacterium CG_4_10_14_0_8_um_filter_39_13 TaxID=1974589 RepID=A0A2M7RFG2_9BACT|nr:MAG: hypothetical protein COZ81_01225 [Candidatus Jorgensenbacteria bacterium CG_4_8_14_3_um_filter_38_10]PIY95478.1 MAG: hypothetical protein COY65_03130 [Candidatus Jorgensenbacteria bacterium CG_4_10_14_0_8_um_filter_39_13]